ncbi:uncharacterized protein LOC100216846 [Zea mays]|uniref:Uncharacterized protein n=1 Tax=Zea mays TaxID=4577 RepID=B4FK04_MAIZE|nr:uncharacterized protein LOC100216846 [Zea mays]ACF82447.1 unknown [Zea mays]|eukprot:NP_001136710.1 uncharacterized protein LOC100216846 [Zea mays]
MEFAQLPAPVTRARRPAPWMLALLAAILLGQRIPSLLSLSIPCSLAADSLYLPWTPAAPLVPASARRGVYARAAPLLAATSSPFLQPGFCFSSAPASRASPSGRLRSQRRAHCSLGLGRDLAVVRQLQRLCSSLRARSIPRSALSCSQVRCPAELDPYRAHLSWCPWPRPASCSTHSRSSFRLPSLVVVSSCWTTSLPWSRVVPCSARIVAPSIPLEPLRVRRCPLARLCLVRVLLAFASRA